MLAGVPVRLLDTAGIETPRDAIEAGGHPAQPPRDGRDELLLVVLDGSVEPDRTGARRDGGSAPGARPGEERSSGPSGCRSPAWGSAGLGRHGRRDGGAQGAPHPRGRPSSGASGDEDGIVATVRQVELLEALRADLVAAEAALADAPLEAALVDLNGALTSLGQDPRSRCRRRCPGSGLLRLLPGQVKRPPQAALAQGASSILGRA